MWACPKESPQRFSTFLRDHLFDRVRPGRIEYIRPEGPTWR